MNRTRLYLLAASWELMGVALPAQAVSTSAPTIQTLAIVDVLKEAKRSRQGLTVSDAVTQQGIEDRFIAGSHALNAIAAIVSNVNQVLGFAKIEEALGTAGNPWSDDGFRNGFDRVESYITSAGLIAAAASAFLPADKQNKGIGISLSFAGVAKLAGSIWGQQSGDKFERAAGRVEFSRRAFDDLRNRYRTTDEYMQANTTLLQDLASFKVRYDSATTSDQKRQALVAASAYLNRLDLVMTQIPAMLQLYEQTIARYCPQAIDAANTPATMGAVICKTQPASERQAVILEGTTRQYLLSAAIELQELKANKDKADEVRKLAPELRGALLGT